MSKFKTHCRITDYIEATNPELAELLNGTCADLTLNSLRGKSGITFLVPDREYIAKISKLAYSTKPEEATMACNMFDALILRDVFKSGADFNAKKKAVVNSLYPAQLVGVSKVSGNTVTFESGAVATLDTGFIDNSKRKNLAVWNLKGEIPIDGPAAPAELLKHVKGGKRSAVGGYDTATALELAKNLRWQIALVVENEYALCLSKRSNDSARPTENPYIRCSMSLIEYLHENDKITLEQVLPILSMGIADFYFLVEPHKNGGHIVSNEHIKAWWENRANHCKTTGCKILREMLKNAGHGKELPRIDAIRKALLPRCNNRNCVQDIEIAYRDYFGNGEEAQLHMLRDELRFLIHCSFVELESSKYDHGKLNETLNMIAEYMHKMSPGAEDIKAGLKVLNSSSLKYAIAPTERLNTINAFVNSNCFLFISLSEAEANSVKSHTCLPGPDTKGLWNIIGAEIEAYKKHDRVTPSGELEAILAQVDPELAKRIREAVSK